ANVGIGGDGEWANTVSLLFGNGNGTFGPAQPFDAGPSVKAVSSGDVDNDGDRDIIVANNGLHDGSVTVLLSDGAGGFAAPTTLTVADFNRPSSVVAGDFDLDGD